MTPVPPDAGDLRLDEDLRQVAAARSRSLGGHPSPQELVDYHFDVLTPEEADAVQEHLSLCRECAQVLLDFAAFSRPEAGEGPSAALDGKWNRLQERLGKDRKETGLRPLSPPKTRRFPWALAASLLLIPGLLVWNLRLREGLRELERPRADAGLEILAPETPGTGRGLEEPVRVEIKRGQSRVPLLLNLGDVRSFPDYRLELADPARGVLWEGADVVRNADGTFYLDLPASLLEPKVYELRLYGQDGGDRIPLARYSFEAVRETPSRNR